jgi:adenylate cyclase, class 2
LKVSKLLISLKKPMPNKLEIEKKYHIKNTSVKELSNIIKKAGAVYIGDDNQRDIYFNVTGRDSLVSKECLRIRESATKKEITYKPATKQKDVLNNFFAKKELDLIIENIETAKDLLLAIGCTFLAEVNKERQCYRLDKFNIFIDNVLNTGLFLEIEILDIQENIQKDINAIDKLMLSLNIADYIIENRPYRDIVIETHKGGTECQSLSTLQKKDIPS